MEPARSYHDVRERRQGADVCQIEQWRQTGGRLYEKRQSPGALPAVRVASGEAGFEMRGGAVRRLRPAEIAQWRREVRMVPLNFEAHASEMGVVSTVEGSIERLEAPRERIILERDARSGVPRRVIDLRGKHTIVFDQTRDAQGRHVPRLEIRSRLDRETWRDRILAVEFDEKPPSEVLRLWEALETGSAL